MAKIPDFTSLGQRPVPTALRPVVVDNSGVILAQALSEATATVSKVVEENRERADRFALSRVKSEFLRRDIELRRELKDDGDYETWEERYREGMGGHLQELSGGLRNTQDTMAFHDDAQLGIERGSLAMYELAFDRETRAGRAGLDEVLANNRTSYLEADDELTRAEILKNSNDAIQTAKQKLYITDEEAVNLGQKTTRDIAKAYVSVQDPDVAVDMLIAPKGTMAEFIDKDEREVLLEKFKGKLVNVKAQGIADQIAAQTDAHDERLRLAKGYDYGEGVDATDVRAEVERRIRQEQTDKKAAREDENFDVFQDWSDKIRTGEATYSDALEDDYVLEVLTHTQMNALSLLNQKKGHPAESDPATWAGVLLLEANDPQKFMRLDLGKVVNELSASDFDYTVKRIRDMRIGQSREPSNQMSALQAVKTVYRAGDNIVKTAHGQATLVKLTKRITGIERERAAAGEKYYRVGDDEMLAMATELAKNVTIEDARFFGLMDVNKRAALITVDDIPQGDALKLTERYQQRNGGRLPTQDELVEAYEQLLIVRGKKK